MKKSYNVNEAKEIFRLKNEETIRRYIRAGHRMGNDYSVIKNISNPKIDGYMALCTVEKVLPYQITCESLLLLLSRKLGISMYDAEAILDSFDNEKDMDESMYIKDTVGAIASTAVANVAGVALRPLGLLGGLISGGILGFTHNASLFDNYEKREIKYNDSDTSYLKDILQEIGEIEEELSRHDDEIKYVRNTLDKMAQEKTEFDLKYDSEVVSGKDIIDKLEKSKEDYRKEIQKLKKEAETVLHNMEEL